MDPLIIYSANGEEHLIMTIWSIRSLQKFKYSNIKVVVSTEIEKKIFIKYLPSIECEIVQVDVKNYNMWAWRPFALSKINLPTNCEIVICDTDILWLMDPRIIFNRFKNQNWVHKITSLDPGEFFDYKSLAEIPKRRIGLRTMYAYKEKIGINNYPNFHINGGLFMLRSDLFKKVYSQLYLSIQKIPPKEMIMTESILSIIFSELNLRPVSDEDDIKHFNIKHRKINKNLVKFKSHKDRTNINGYDVAKHFYGDQRNQIPEYVVKLSLDTNNLLYKYKLLRFKNKILSIYKKITKKIKNAN